MDHVDAAVVEQERAILSSDEQARADRLKVEAARLRTILGQAALRRVLARYTDRDPSRIMFRFGRHGKPFIDHGDIEFNLSHSGHVALVAVTQRIPVGIDVEEINPRHSIDAIASRFFSPTEQAAYRDVPVAERHYAFFRCWSRKEAVIKAIGEGLACPLSSFDVSLDREDARLLGMRRADADVSRWIMVNIEAARGYCAAAAVIGPCRGAVGFNFDLAGR
jgi:4'-phosphopantetheinyl transferase